MRTTHNLGEGFSCINYTLHNHNRCCMYRCINNTCVEANLAQVCTNTAGMPAGSDQIARVLQTLSLTGRQLQTPPRQRSQHRDHACRRATCRSRSWAEIKSRHERWQEMSRSFCKPSTPRVSGFCQHIGLGDQEKYGWNILDRMSN